MNHNKKEEKKNKLGERRKQNQEETRLFIYLL
jgi:hypothetical protein